MLLLDRGSLTQRLRTAYPDFALHLQSEGWARPSWSEAKRLNCSEKSTGWLRIITLNGHQTPLIYARTFIPQETLKSQGRTLQHLGTQSVGDLLFAYQSPQRDPIEYSLLLPEHPLFRAAVEHVQEELSQLWARRSVLYFHEHPLLVTEVFLPSVLRVGMVKKRN